MNDRAETLRIDYPLQVLQLLKVSVETIRGFKLGRFLRKTPPVLFHDEFEDDNRKKFFNIMKQRIYQAEK